MNGKAIWGGGRIGVAILMIGGGLGLGVLLLRTVPDRSGRDALSGPGKTALAKPEMEADAESAASSAASHAPLPINRFLFAGAVKGFTNDYAQFLGLSKLSVEDKRKLMHLAAERGLLVMTVPQARKSGRFATWADSDAFFRAENARLASEIKGLTGDEYEAFVKASEEVPIRQEMDVFSSMVAGSGVPLTADQKALLIMFTWQEYKAAGVDFFFSRKYSRVDDGRKFVAEITRKSQANTVIRSYAAEFLTESQLEKLKGFQIAQIQGRWLSKHLPQKPGNDSESTVKDSTH